MKINTKMAIQKFAKYCISVTMLVSLFYNLDYYISCKGFEQLNISPDLKSIFVWTSITSLPIKYLGEGRNTFLDRGCFFNNCHVSSNKQLRKDVAHFDVVLFHGPELSDDVSNLPQSRSPHQKYVFASMESAGYYPVCNQMYNSYFNWTWTYKLNSDEYFGYIVITDKEGKVIGPKKEMHWEKLEAMMPINDTLKAKLSTKKIAAAWFVSNCCAPSGRDLIAREIQIELAKYDMKLDIFGSCGTKKCPKDNMKKCFRKLETDYYFYLSFENSMGVDYVTEKLLTALNHYTVPVVYGGANYTRYMPDGIYLSVQEVTIRKLVKEMVNIIDDKQKYYDFFKWHNHYSYDDGSRSPETDPYCKFCALVNNEEQFFGTSVYENFSQWWSPHKCNSSNVSDSCNVIFLFELTMIFLVYRDL